MPRPVPQRASSRSILQVYLGDINQTPLLSVDEERALAGRIAQGDPYARDHLVRANLRLVVSIARGFLGRGLGLEDLIAEGNLGLLRAVESFDGTLEVRFTTYAAYWIKQSIRNAIIKHGKPIRLPAYLVNLLSKWRRAHRLLAEQLGREPSAEEVGRALKLKKKRLAVAMQALAIDELMPQHVESREAPDYLLHEVLEDGRSKPVDQWAMESEELGRVLAGLNRLSERESQVIRLRYGLGTASPMTLNEAGEVLGLTRERVRQIEKEAFRQLIAKL
jgi:RNA polymerase primary sigma factor